MKTIFMASDHAGAELKNFIYLKLLNSGFKVFDCGCESDDGPVDYPDYVLLMVQKLVASPLPAAGILICGTGIGMSIAANRYSQIRAALCNNEVTAKYAREHNNANVLCMGARLITKDEAERILNTFLNTEFKAGRHERRIKKIEKLNGNCGTS